MEGLPGAHGRELGRGVKFDVYSKLDPALPAAPPDADDDFAVVPRRRVAFGLGGLEREVEPSMTARWMATMDVTGAPEPVQ